MEINKESILSNGYEEFTRKDLLYEGGDLLTFKASKKVDAYYVPSINNLKLVTGRFNGMGNIVLFDGKITDIEGLKFVITAVTAFEK